MTNKTKNEPYATIRDGSLKATMWINQSEKGPFLSTQYRRTYKDQQGNLQDTDSLGGTDHLKLARLAALVYDKDLEFRAEQREKRREEQPL